MSMQYIRDYYKVPATRGARVRWAGMTETREGTIVGSRGAHLRVRFDGSVVIHTMHPTWQVEYLEGGTS